MFFFDNINNNSYEMSNGVHEHHTHDDNVEFSIKIEVIPKPKIINSLVKKDQSDIEKK